MILRALLAFLALVLVGALLRLAWLRWRTRPGRLLSAIAVGAVLALLLVAVASGRLHWLYTVPAALLPLLLRARRVAGTIGGLGGLGGSRAGGASADGASRVSARFLEMRLDHATGALRGEIREGPHAGRSLSELRFDTLLELHAQWRLEDPDSARLLETWLDRTRGAEWRDQARADAGADRQADARGEMNRAEALEVLGLEGEPEREEIVRAHRRLMQQFHPDRGGSDYLAAQLNRAKDRLLADLEAR